MSREEAELARAIHEMRPEEFFELFADRIEIDHAAYPLPDFPGTVRGREQAISFYRHYWGTFEPETYRLEVERVIDAGDRVITLNREEGTARQSGIRLERTWAAVWTFEEGRITRLQLYRTLEEALEAADVSP